MKKRQQERAAALNVPAAAVRPMAEHAKQLSAACSSTLGQGYRRAMWGRILSWLEAPAAYRRLTDVIVSKCCASS